MKQLFTPEQSREIDDRIVEMMTAVMGVGQYSRICRDIADRRAAMVAASAIEEALPDDDRAARLEAIAEQALALTERALALASGAAARLSEQLERANLAPLPPEYSAPQSLTSKQEARVRAIAHEVGNASREELRSVAHAAARGAFLVNRDRQDRRG